MSKIDFKRELKELYNPPMEFEVVNVPTMQFLMVDGHGDPNVAQEYQDALEAIYAVAYKLKFISKNTLGKDYVVPPLEGLWWAEDMEAFTVERDKSVWEWTMMIMTPEWIAEDIFTEAIWQVRKGKTSVSLEKIRFKIYNEGLAVQIMHVGSYDDETPTLKKLHEEFIPRQGYEVNGKHHEIYLSDPRRVMPDKLKTILRQPVKPIGT